MNGVIVFGTDTDCGKTFICTKIINQIKNCVYYKPFSTGGQKVNGKITSPDMETVVKNTRLIENKTAFSSIRYMLPSSPYGAILNGEPEWQDDLLNQDIEKIKNIDKYAVIEGIGGISVPLKKGIFTDEWYRRFNLPVILVSNIKLGAINHTLLSIYRLEQLGYEIKTVIFNKMDKEDTSNTIKTLKDIVKYPNIVYNLDSEIIKLKD